MIDRYDIDVVTDRWQVAGHDAAAGPAVDQVVGFAMTNGMDRGLLGGVESVVAHAVSGVGRLVDGSGDVTIEAAADGDCLSVRILTPAAPPAFAAPALAMNLEWGGGRALVGAPNAMSGVTITLEFDMTGRH
jgi:hypothetical protein